MIHYKNLLTINLKSEFENNKDKSNSKIPREHQIKAQKEMSKFFLQDGKNAGILVLPTGGGKTYTTVYWLLKNIISKNIKVLWLADQGFLLEQARETFRENILEIGANTKSEINILVVSGSDKHADTNKKDILKSDILLMTSQTAISNWEDEYDTYFKKFINQNAKEGNLFIVYDEAHHTPAFGRRNLLIGRSENKTGIIEKFPKTQLLGLTATPTYTDKKQKGWLWEIFNGGIISEVFKKDLEDQNILASPVFIQEKTNFNLVLSDNDVDNLVFKHQELPSYIVEEIAKNIDRNNFISQYYCDNKVKFGKTIIFLDRWYQCKMVENYINEKAGKEIALSVFSYVDGNKNTDYINNRTSNQNDINLDRFKKGEIDVLINVKMLTEGVDVPDVRTVFLTRDTNSTILFTQMIGRALRGSEFGGNKTTANIVLFSDNWNKHVQFASNRFFGGKGDSGNKERGYRPFELMRMDLLDKLELEYLNQDYERSVFDLIPIGWYVVAYTDTIQEEDENYQLISVTDNFRENVIVLEHEKTIFEKVINEYSIHHKNIIWDNDILDIEKAENIISKFLSDNDFIPNKATISKLIQIARHLGQDINNESPKYFTFEQKNMVNLIPFVEEVLKRDMRRSEEENYLQNEYNKNTNPFFKSLFYNYDEFLKAYEYDFKVFKKKNNNRIEISDASQERKEQRMPEEIRKIVFSRDRNTCLCCGKNKDLRLDHIISHKHEEPENDNPDFFQTLCSICNGVKSSSHEYNFKEGTIFDYDFQKMAIKDVPTNDTEDPIFYFTRLINCYFKISAVNKNTVKAKNHGKSKWYAEIKYGVNPEETILKHRKELVEMIKSKGYRLKDIEIISK